MSDLPYRPNVGAVLFNRDGKVLVARRANLPNAEGPAGGWQLPQGGIDAALRRRSVEARNIGHGLLNHDGGCAAQGLSVHDMHTVCL